PIPALYTLSLHDALPIFGDSTVVSFDPLAGGGWVWIPPQLNGLRLQRPGEPQPRDLPKPDRNGNVFSVAAAPDGARLVTIGWNRSEEHTSELQSRVDLVC